MAVHHDKFLIVKPTRCTNFSKVFILEWNSTCFRQFLSPSSGVFHCTHNSGIYHTGLLTACEQELSSILILLASCQQTCMTYTTAVCTVENSWWWTEELSKTCRVSFQNKNYWEISISNSFIIRKVIHVYTYVWEVCWWSHKNFHSHHCCTCTCSDCQ